jgi:hypothetical protein
MCCSGGVGMRLKQHRTPHAIVAVTGVGFHAVVLRQGAPTRALQPHSAPSPTLA